MRRLGLALAIALAALTTSATAQPYPNRPVRVLVPFAAGGAVDVLARLLGGKISESIGQPVLIENRPGAGGNLAADAVAKSPADGYTILHTPNGQAISPSLYRKLPFDVFKDFIPVTQLVSSHLIFVTGPDGPIRSMRELIALAKAKPGGLNYGSSGVGNPLHLTMEMFKHAAGVDILPVPYRSDAQINAALIAGEVQVAVVPLSGARPLVESGKLRALGIAGGTRSAAMPDVPTVAEQGVPGLNSTSWHGFYVAANTPAAIVSRIHLETAKALHDPQMAQRLRALTYEPVGSSPQEFAVFFRSEVEKFAKVVKDAKIPMQD